MYLVHELCYWLAYIPYLLCDAVPWLHRYRLQPTRTPDSVRTREIAKRVILQHLFLVLPIILATHPLFDMMGMRHDLESLPKLSTVCTQIVVFFLMEDFLFYLGHRALHTPYLYRTVHCIHHENSAPIGIAAEYAHPFEVMFLGFATILPPMVVGPHLFTLLIYLALRSFQTVECHSGYDLPISPNHWIPLYGGARFHDHHHRIHSGNYSSTFTLVDFLFGTDTAYKLWEQKQKIPARHNGGPHFSNGNS